MMRYIKGRWIRTPKGRRLRSLRIRHLVCLFLILLLGLAVISEIALSSVTQELTEQVTQQYMANSISKAVEDMLSDTKNTGEFIVITEDDSGEIGSIQTNTSELNTLMTKLTASIQKKLNGSSSVGVPVGSFTNIAVLNGRGFSIPLKMNFEGSVNISFESEIESAGINQSCYRIYMTVYAETVSQSETFSAYGVYETSYIISETVIVGEVPSFVTGLNNNS